MMRESNDKLHSVISMYVSMKKTSCILWVKRINYMCI